MKLTNPTDDELNACFAEHVCGREHHPELTDPDYGYREHWEKAGEELWFRDNQTLGIQMPRFAQSADAVLPWLEKWHTEAGRLLTLACWIVLVRKDAAAKDYFRATDKSFSRAAVIALLRAHGVEIEFK